jgi:hypothetical protein
MCVYNPQLRGRLGLMDGAKYKYLQAGIHTDASDAKKVCAVCSRAALYSHDHLCLSVFTYSLVSFFARVVLLTTGTVPPRASAYHQRH